ncbi:MAG: hypothetical protein J0M26_20330 [Planctomycetes bacterium]|nr:hypothetical protein [Planctomycetota bacterium]
MKGFPLEFFAGGGKATLIEQGSVIVTRMVCMKLDRPFRSEQALLQPDRGLLWWKRSILQALLVWAPKQFSWAFLGSHRSRWSRITA